MSIETLSKNHGFVRQILNGIPCCTVHGAVASAAKAIPTWGTQVTVDTAHWNRDTIGVSINRTDSDVEEEGTEAPSLSANLGLDH